MGGGVVFLRAGREGSAPPPHTPMTREESRPSWGNQAGTTGVSLITTPTTEALCLKIFFRNKKER